MQTFVYRCTALSGWVVNYSASLNISLQTEKNSAEKNVLWKLPKRVWKVVIFLSSRQWLTKNRWLSSNSVWVFAFLSIIPRKAQFYSTTVMNRYLHRAPTHVCPHVSRWGISDTTHSSISRFGLNWFLSRIDCAPSQTCYSTVYIRHDRVYHGSNMYNKLKFLEGGLLLTV